MDETIIRGTATDASSMVVLIRASAGAPALRRGRPLRMTPGTDPPVAAGTARRRGAALLNRLEQLLQQNDRDDFPSLLSTPDITGEEAEQATDDLFSYERPAPVVQRARPHPAGRARSRATVITSSSRS